MLSRASVQSSQTVLISLAARLPKCHARNFSFVATRSDIHREGHQQQEISLGYKQYSCGGSLQSRFYTSTTFQTNKERIAQQQIESLDDLKHMELPVQEFALGCSFLHQTALGNFSELQAMAKAQPSLVNFRDYDRRTPYVFLFCSGLQ